MKENMLRSYVFETELDEICLFPPQNKKNSFTSNDENAAEVAGRRVGEIKIKIKIGKHRYVVAKSVTFCLLLQDLLVTGRKQCHFLLPIPEIASQPELHGAFLPGRPEKEVRARRPRRTRGPRVAAPRASKHAGPARGPRGHSREIFRP